MAAIFAAAAARLPAYRFVFLDWVLDQTIIEAAGGRFVFFAAIAGTVLAVVQLVGLRRPRSNWARWAAGTVAALGVVTGIAVALLGVRIGLFPDAPPEMQPSPGRGATVVILAGVIYAELSGLRMVRLLTGRWRAEDGSPMTPSGRSAVRGTLLVLAPPCLLLVVLLWAERWAPHPEVEPRPPAGFVPEAQRLLTEPAPDIVAQELERLRGDWKVVRSVPPGVPEGWITFDGRKLTLMSRHPQPSQVFIDPTKSPKQIDIAIKEGVLQVWVLGIYELDGDHLALYMMTEPVFGKPDERPRSFTDNGPGQIWHFERVRVPPGE